MTDCLVCNDTGWVEEPLTITISTSRDRVNPVDEEAVEELDARYRQGCPHCRADAERRGRRVGGAG